MVVVNCIDRIDDFQKLESEWSRLWQEDRMGNSLFSSHEWYRTWWKHFGGEMALFIVVAREGEKIIGIAPLCLKKTVYRGVPVRMVAFMENGNSLHNDFILAPDRKAEALSAILNYLFENCRRWDLVELKNMPSGKHYPLCRELFDEMNVKWRVRTGLNSPCIRIDAGWETFYAGRSGRARKTIRNIRNRLNKWGSCRLQKISNWADYQAARDQIRSIAENSWTQKAGDSLASSRNLAFFDDLTRIACERRWLALWLLQVNGEAVAFEYHLQCNGKNHGLRASYKEEHARLSPGGFLDYLIVKELFESTDGVTEYDMGGSFDIYKRKWTTEFRSHVNVHIFNRRISSRLLHAWEYGVIGGLRQLRDLGAKSRRPRIPEGA